MSQTNKVNVMTVVINILASFYLFSIVDMRLADTLNYFPAKKWPRTQGVITRVELAPAENHFLFFEKVGIRPRVWFNYKVGSKEYLGTKPWLGADTVVYSRYEHGIYTTYYKDGLLADYINRNYQVGDTITVYYNASSPEQSIIEHQDAFSGFWSYWIYRILATFFMLNAIKLMLYKR